jgi:imidazoleglycerol-phosphate dehydratase
MAARGQAVDEGRLRARVSLAGTGTANVVTGLSVLDHLLDVLARYGSFDLALEVAPEEADAQIAAAGRALGDAVSALIRAPGARGHGSAALPAEEALAHVALEASASALVVSNADLSGAHVGGLGSDLLASFLHELAEGAGLTLHVRLLAGDEAQHVLDAVFKALGVALAQACRQASEGESE